jgi:DNA-directed RNA polymerase subunit alpha
MRVGDKTNHNRLRISIETDGTLSAREALESSISIMIEQLNAILDFKHVLPKDADMKEEKTSSKDEATPSGDKEDLADVLKTRIDTLDLSTRTLNALTEANIRTVGGIARKKKEDLLELPGMGEKGIQEIKKILSSFGITLK